MAQCKLIAAYVSALNSCQCCHGVHTATAVSFAGDQDLVTALVADIDSAAVDATMKRVLHLVCTLTLTPATVRGSEVASVYAADWDEQALHDAVSVCSLFNFMNRLVEGLGSTAAPDYYQTSSRRLAGAAGYAGLRDLLPGPHGQGRPPSWQAADQTRIRE